MPVFSKRALTTTEQVTLLQQRGMQIDQPLHAAACLGQINYYRLGAYWLPFEADHATHGFRPGTTFEQVLRLYAFDRELRLLILDAIECVEVAVRTRWAYEMAHRHGAHGYMDAGLAKSRPLWEKNLTTLSTEISRSDEVFIAHYRQRYSQPALPPVWVACEVMSLGLLSRWYAQLGPAATRQAIAGYFECDQGQFEGLLVHLTYLRNICAHHSRIWNRRFTKTMPLPKTKPAGIRKQLNSDADRKLYNSLTMLLHLMQIIAPLNPWRQRLCGLLAAHPHIPLLTMGFPPDWERHPLWQ